MSQYGQLLWEDAGALARHRTARGWEVCSVGDRVWVRALRPEADAWQGLPFLGRFDSDAQGRLVPVGGTVPVARAPSGPWYVVADWLPLQRSVALLGGVKPLPLGMKPERLGLPEEEPSVLLVSLAVWSEWALSAAELRLSPLRFAVASDRRVCVLGRPLPSLQGEAWVLRGSIATPAGYSLPSHCVPEWIEQTLQVPSGGLALWHVDGTAEVLPASAFVPATRANVRASLMPC
jgi:hypothetical protein